MRKKKGNPLAPPNKPDIDNKDIVAALLTVAFEASRQMAGSYVPDVQSIWTTYSEFRDRLIHREADETQAFQWWQEEQEEEQGP